MMDMDSSFNELQLKIHELFKKGLISSDDLITLTTLNRHVHTPKKASVFFKKETVLNKNDWFWGNDK